MQYVLGNKVFAVRARGGANSRGCDMPPLTKETGQRGSSDATSPSFVARRETASVAYCDGHGAVLIFPPPHRLTLSTKGDAIYDYHVATVQATLTRARKPECYEDQQP